MTKTVKSTLQTVALVIVSILVLSWGWRWMQHRGGPGVVFRELFPPGR